MNKGQKTIHPDVWGISSRDDVLRLVDEVKKNEADKS